ncbi:MAG: S-layer homology domain-containing protein [Clostridiales bacterium]|nr:S-layer homology domain-containing protein [Clostridiales bacterium]
MKDTIIKKTLSLVTALSCVAGIAMAVSATEAVEITEATFPDETFRTYISEKFDTDSDGFLSESEIDSAREIVIDGKGIKDLKGIENLTNLNRLYCDNNKLTSIDLSANKDLSLLYIENNKLSSLDVSKNTGLNGISCANNKITSLDVSGLKELESLEVQENNLAELDITNNPKLKYLQAYSNKFTKLDISKNPNLILAYTDGEPFEFGFDYDRIIRYADDNNNLLSISKSVELITGLEEYDGILFDLDDPNPNENVARIRCGSFSKPSVTGAGDEEVKFNVSDESIAKIDDDGNIVGIKAGLVTITATCGEKTAVRKVRILYMDLTDETSFWYVPTYYLTDAGVVKGYDKQTKFKATNKCTRAQMVTFIWRLAGSPEPEGKTCKFTDVKKSDYFYKACIWGNENHIVEGYSNNTFRPKVVCARRHAVTFLWRLAGSPEPETTSNKFIDVETKDYFYKPTLWASEKKILEGYGDDTFRPNGACLRRQMTTFLYKYDKFVNGKG